MSEASHRTKATEPVREGLHLVEWSEFEELLISRRRLERVSHHGQCLRDRVSNEYFVVGSPSDERSVGWS